VVTGSGDVQTAPDILTQWFLQGLGGLGGLAAGAILTLAVAFLKLSAGKV
jgi:hypothetical protein